MYVNYCDLVSVLSNYFDDCICDLIARDVAFVNALSCRYVDQEGGHGIDRHGSEYRLSLASKRSTFFYYDSPHDVAAHYENFTVISYHELLFHERSDKYIVKFGPNYETMSTARTMYRKQPAWVDRSIKIHEAPLWYRVLQRMPVCKGAELDSDELDVLPLGTRVRAIEEYAFRPWVKIDRPISGWCRFHSSNGDKNLTLETTWYRVCKRMLVRKGKEFHSEALDCLLSGTRVRGIAHEGRRVKIDKPIAGWCSLHKSNGDTILTLEESSTNATNISPDCEESDEENE